MTTEEFILKAQAVHGDKYDYSKVEYVNNKTKVCIICPEHGEDAVNAGICLFQSALVKGEKNLLKKLM